MTLQWATRTWPRDLPGHWDYLSGTWGDAALLPVTVGLLWRWSKTCDTPASNQVRWPTIAGGIAGGLLGTSSQIAWLTDPSPRPNWVLPTAHHFSSAGWYHAVFLISVSALVGSLTARIVQHQRNSQTAPTRVATTALFAAATTFAGLVVADSTASIDTPSSQATIGLISAAATLTAIGLPLATRQLHLLPAALVGLITGTAASALAIVTR